MHHPDYVFEAVAAWRADLEERPDDAPLCPMFLQCKHCPAWRPFKDDAECDLYSE